MSNPLSGTLALAQLSQQATAALANVTINFAVWKYESPAEYQPLRNVLTSKRKEAAEDGSFHTTACKLGALFAPLLPKVPRLAESYGRRASDIASSWTNSATCQTSLGAFAEHAGIDGTTILAAATSGEAAIAVHLLACMLARQLRADKATAAWEELVVERKAQLLRESQNSVPIDTLMASRVDINTQELAAWDASARAWLGVANSVESRRQKQLMLIFDNIEGVVRTLATTYDTILSAWYPLVAPGGVLRVGLLEDSPQASRTGVYWSLSLSRLRYYGDARITESVMNIDTSNLTLEDFSIVALGAASCHWTPTGTSLDDVCKLFIFLDEFVRKECSTLTQPWTVVFSQAAKRLQSLRGIDHDFAVRLFKLGQRNKNLFESEPGCALFDLDGRSGLMQIFAKVCDEPRHKADLLHIAINSRFSAQKNSLCIVRKTADQIEYTLELPSNGAIIRPEIAELETSLQLHVSDLETQLDILRCLPPDRMRKPGGYLVPLRASSRAPFERFAWVDPPSAWLGSRKSSNVRPSLRASNVHHRVERIPENFEYQVFQLMYGDDTVGIFCDNCSRMPLTKKMWDLEDILFALQNGSLQIEKLLDRMHKHIHSVRTFAAAYEALREMPQMKVSLEDMFTSSFGTRRWAVKNIDRWEEAKQTQSQDMYLKRCFSIPKIKTAQTFAAIASLSAGVHDLEAIQLKDVLALSFQDSLFVVKALLEDPYYTSDQVVRIPGNIGRPGLALLIPPTNPKIRSSDPTRWAMVNHFDFDGNAQDCFASTDMSIWFTDYQSAVNQHSRSGEKFINAFFLECVVSVYDNGRWIADVDVVRNKKDMYRYEPLVQTGSTSILSNQPVKTQIVSLDNWDEVLASEELTTKRIARASQNWLGRLALATIAQQKGEKVVVLPPEGLSNLESVVTSFAGTDPITHITWNFENVIGLSEQPFFFIH